MFVKFSCGCVGLNGVQGLPLGHTILIKACDGESGEDICFHPRTMLEDKRGGGEGLKDFVPLSDEEAGKLVQKMGRLLMDGHRLHTVRSLLTS